MRLPACSYLNPAVICSRCKQAAVACVCECCLSSVATLGHNWHCREKSTTHRDFCRPTPFLPYNTAVLDAEANRSAAQGSYQPSPASPTGRPSTSPGRSTLEPSDSNPVRAGSVGTLPHPERAHDVSGAMMSERGHNPAGLDQVKARIEANINALAAPSSLKDPSPHAEAERPATSSPASRAMPPTGPLAGPRPVTAPAPDHVHPSLPNEGAPHHQPPREPPSETSSGPADADAPPCHRKEADHHTAGAGTPRPPLETPRQRCSGGAGSAGRRHEEGKGSAVGAAWEWGRTGAAPWRSAYAQDFAGGPQLVKATREAAAALLLHQVGRNLQGFRV